MKNLLVFVLSLTLITSCKDTENPAHTGIPVVTWDTTTPKAHVIYPSVFDWDSAGWKNNKEFLLDSFPPFLESRDFYWYYVSWDAIHDKLNDTTWPPHVQAYVIYTGKNLDIELTQPLFKKYRMMGTQQNTINFDTCCVDVFYIQGTIKHLQNRLK